MRYFEDECTLNIKPVDMSGRRKVTVTHTETGIKVTHEDNRDLIDLALINQLYRELEVEVKAKEQEKEKGKDE